MSFMVAFAYRTYETILFAIFLNTDVVQGLSIVQGTFSAWKVVELEGGTASDFKH